MNLNKSVLFPLKDDNLMEINGITLKEKVTYLGVFIDKDIKIYAASMFLVLLLFSNIISYKIFKYSDI